MGSIAIIGAGMAGVTAASALADAGRAVTLFDKSRGYGGRMATRRGDGFALDHGAPGVAARDPAFRSALTGAGGAAHPALGIVGDPGMSSIVKAMANGVPAQMGVEIAAISQASGGLELTDTGGVAHGPFAQVICAVPAPQAVRLAAGIAGVEAALAGVIMAPTWSLLLAFDAPAELPRRADPFAKIIEDGAKPGRANTWVAHASIQWSRAHLEETREAVAERLLATLGPLPAPRYASAHRWRYAFTEAPLGAPFHSALGGRLLFGGDWALGPDAEHAWQSGRAMAAAVLS